MQKPESASEAVSANTFGISLWIDETAGLRLAGTPVLVGFDGIELDCVVFYGGQVVDVGQPLWSSSIEIVPRRNVAANGRRFFLLPERWFSREYVYIDNGYPHVVPRILPPVANVSAFDLSWNVYTAEVRLPVAVAGLRQTLIWRWSVRTREASGWGRVCPDEDSRPYYRPLSELLITSEEAKAAR